MLVYNSPRPITKHKRKQLHSTYTINMTIIYGTNIPVTVSLKHLQQIITNNKTVSKIAGNQYIQTTK